MSDFAIRTRELSRLYGSVHAVDGLSLGVPAGSIFGFLGPNGAGKTTTIRLLLGLVEPDSGEANVLGFDVRRDAAAVRERSGALLEHPGLYERLSAEDNLDFYGRVWHMTTTDRRVRIKELLTHLGLWERRRQVAGTWSRGMKQKLAVARALFHRPRLVFLDEPTAGLDPVAAAALHRDLTSLATRENVTVFLTTHNLAEAEKLCGLVGVIRAGTLLTVGSPQELRARQGRPTVEMIGRGFDDQILAALRARPEVSDVDRRAGGLVISLSDGADVAPLTTLVVTAGAQVEEIHRSTASLEAVFLALMEEDR